MTEQKSLLGIADIAAMAKATPQTVNNWRERYDHFPPAYQNLASGPVWQREVIEAWVQNFRGVRTNVISFINLKGGVGKTTTAVAVAEILAHEDNKHVLLIDLDPQTNASAMLITEEQWQDMDAQGRTLAQLFEDRLNPHNPPKFNIETAIARCVSTVDQGIARLDLLASSIRLVDLQDQIVMIGSVMNYTISPINILRAALLPIIERYDYVIIDCPPSLGIVTKNGLRMATGYVIPTIPDILSTWGIFQIIKTIERFGDDIERRIEPLGILATKVQKNMLHDRILAELEAGRLGGFARPDAGTQPKLFEHKIPQTVAVGRGASPENDIRTLKGKYGDAYQPLRGFTSELRALCETKNH